MAQERLVMDLPWNTSSYVYQTIRIPYASQVELSLKVWGSNVRTYAGITVTDSSGEHLVDWFLVQVLEGWKGAPYLRTYDLTEFEGRAITLRIYGSGEWVGSSAGQFVFVDDVQIQAASGRQSLIVKRVFAEPSGKTPGHTERVEPGQPLVLAGTLYPNHETVIRIEYTSPYGQSVEREVYTDSLGNFNDTFIPDRPGIWTAVVYWNGDADHDGCASQPIQFAVCLQSGVYLSSLTVSGIRVNDLNLPEIQVEPNETISGEIQVALVDNNQFAAVLVLALDSWEESRYDLVGGQDTIPAEALDLKLTWFGPPEEGILPTHRAPDSGSYIVPMRYEFPQSMSLSPTYRVPQEGNTYYIVVASGEVNSPDQLLGPKTLLNELWKEPSGEGWDSLLPARRNQTTLFTIRLVVVEVASTFSWAEKMLSDLRKNATPSTLSELQEAEEEMTKAIQARNDRNLILAKTLALEAGEIAQEGVRHVESQARSSLTTAWLWMMASTNVVSPEPNQEIAREYYSSILVETSEGDYRQAMLLAERLQTLVSSDVLWFLALGIMLWLGFGDLTTHLMGKFDPVSLLRRAIRRLLRSRLRRYHTLLAAIVVFAIVELIQGILGSGYPPIGSLLLAAAVVGGWRYPILKRSTKSAKAASESR